MTEELATLGFEHAGGATVASLRGEVDMSNADELLARILAEASGTSPLILDLSACTYLDSAGLGAIARIDAACRGRGVALRLVVAEATSVDRVLAMTGMHDLLAVDRSRDDALARAGSDRSEPRPEHR